MLDVAAQGCVEQLENLKGSRGDGVLVVVVVQGLGHGQRGSCQVVLVSVATSVHYLPSLVHGPRKVPGYIHLLCQAQRA